MQRSIDNIRAMFVSWKKYQGREENHFSTVDDMENTKEKNIKENIWLLTTFVIFPNYFSWVMFGSYKI